MYFKLLLVLVFFYDSILIYICFYKNFNHIQFFLNYPILSPILLSIVSIPGCNLARYIDTEKSINQHLQAEIIKNNKTIKASHLNLIINLIDIYEWDRARTLQILPILKLQRECSMFSLFGHQSEFLVNILLPFQERIFTCLSCSSSSDSKFEIYLIKDADNKIMISNGLEQQCKSCKNQIFGKFKAQPFCIFVQLLSSISFLELPLQLLLIMKYLIYCVFRQPQNLKASHILNALFIYKNSSIQWMTFVLKNLLKIQKKLQIFVTVYIIYLENIFPK